jgi:hypothetical protein
MFIRVCSVAVSIVLASLAVGAPANAAERSGNYFRTEPVAKGSELRPSPEKYRARRLKKSKLIRGDLGGFVYAQPLEFANVVRTGINCPKSNCTLEAVMTVQYSVDADDNPYGICFVVDGEIVDPGCPVLGVMDMDGDFAADTTTAIAMDLKQGKHTVQVQFISDAGASLFMYDVTLNVFKK